ncbi:hypothetical protein DBA29_22435 [Xenophilus aerolatus]|nr:hypothetical protein [Xenophilus aerolatus]
MSKEVSVNLFDVEWSEDRFQQLSVTLDEYAALPLNERWRDDIRLERVELHQSQGQNVYLLDFSKRRDVGPGRLGHVAPIAAIRLAQDEDFGEETAAMYVPARRWLLVLHNQSGVGPSRMMSYFNALDPGVANRHFDYAARPRLDPGAQQRFGGMRAISTVSVTATLDALAAAQAGTGTSLAEATRSVGAKRVKVELLANEAYGRGDRLANGPTRNFIRGLLRQDPAEVTHLEVKGEVDGRDQLIDLIEHKVRRKYSANELVVVHHRYTLESRWNLLLRTHRHWLANL